MRNISRTQLRVFFSESSDVLGIDANYKRRNRVERVTILGQMRIRTRAIMIDISFRNRRNHISKLESHDCWSARS